MKARLPAILAALWACGGAEPRAEPQRAKAPTATAFTASGEAGAADNAGAPATRSPATSTSAATSAETTPAAPAARSPEADAGCTAALAEADEGQQRSASTWNTAGYRCYQAGRLADAAGLFERALAANEAHALAHYNLACVLALLRAQGQVCEHDAFASAILEHLARAVALDPKRQARMKEDADLDAVRDLPRFRVLTGADPSTRRGAVQALQGATFFGRPQGAFGHLDWVTLTGQAPHKDLGDGALPARFLTRVVTDAGEAVDTERTGGWAVDADGALLLDPDGGDPGPEVVRLKLGRDGHLRAPGANEDAPPTYLGAPDECSA